MISRLMAGQPYQPKHPGSRESQASYFTSGLVEKLTFVCLHQLDLVLTVIGVSLGLSEVNPLMRGLLEAPPGLLLVKVAVPLLMALLIPGRLLLPAIAVLALVVVWNLKELLVFLF